MASGVPWYWKNRDLSQGFDEKINLSPGDCQKVQELLDQTFQHKGTRDRKDRLPSRLLVSQVIRMEHSRLWQRFERKKKDLAARVGRPPLISELPGSGAVKTALELPAFAAGPELPAFLKEITRELNEAFLFHGSSPGGALGIGENGFDISRAGSSTGSMFGAGAYLAEASSKSDEYATEDPSGLFGGSWPFCFVARSWATSSISRSQTFAESKKLWRHTALIASWGIEKRPLAPIENSWFGMRHRSIPSTW